MKILFIDSSIEKFVSDLESKTKAKTFRNFDLLEKFGPHLGMPHSKKVGKELLELRIKSVNTVRIFYTFRHEKIYLLHGFFKKSNKLPMKELHVAENKLKKLH